MGSRTRSERCIDRQSPRGSAPARAFQFSSVQIMTRYHVPLTYVCDLKTRDLVLRGVDKYIHTIPETKTETGTGTKTETETGTGTEVERIEPELAPGVVLAPDVVEIYERQRRSKAAGYKTEEWFRDRATRVNGSECATVLGKNKYEKVKRLWQKKTGQIPRDYGVNKYMVSWGSRLEDEAMQVYAVLTRTHYVTNNTGSVVHPEHDFLGATPDFIIVNGVLVEIKCPRTRKITHSVPRHYYPQLQMQLAVTGLKVCHFVQYKPPTLLEPGQLDIKVVEYDPLWFSQVVGPCKDFSDAIKTFYAKIGREPGTDTRDVRGIDVLRAETPLLPLLQRNAEWCEQFLADPEDEPGPEERTTGPELLVDETSSDSVDTGDYVSFRMFVESDVPVFAN